MTVSSPAVIPAKAGIDILECRVSPSGVARLAPRLRRDDDPSFAHHGTLA
ncbi:hypothetical protein [Stakelama marina]|uniref:Uncharacterized protein n=1 Tax=Stakelama marina TaxID=2826939 RepID=A0A8T4IJZ1_9SPHN|nr:hypothetical protein [Stakelama marina]MBR0552669.1 hypothetical protein [Stakelama marina]